MLTALLGLESGKAKGDRRCQSAGHDALFTLRRCRAVIRFHGRPATNGVGGNVVRALSESSPLGNNTGYPNRTRTRRSAWLRMPTRLFFVYTPRPLLSHSPLITYRQPAASAKRRLLYNLLEAPLYQPVSAPQPLIPSPSQDEGKLIVTKHKKTPLAPPDPAVLPATGHQPPAHGARRAKKIRRRCIHQPHPPQSPAAPASIDKPPRPVYNQVSHALIRARPDRRALRNSRETERGAKPFLRSRRCAEPFCASNE